MSTRCIPKHLLVAATVLLLVLALVACAPFGRARNLALVATQPPAATETPLPVLPTYTPTRPPPTPTAKATNGPAESATVEGAATRPTMTPTTEVAAQSSGSVSAQASGGSAVTPQAEVPQATTYKVTRKSEMGNVLKNGSFEEGFNEQGVAQGWTAFSTQDAAYAWLDETDLEHVSHDDHAQLMRVMGPGKPDRFVGIYQTVEVVAGETYTLALHGLIRSSTAKENETFYGHRLQWAVDSNGGTDWQAINSDWSAWTDSGWNDVPLGAKDPQMNVYVQQITPDTDKLTLYIRGWTKWPILNSEAKYYVDGISLQGPVPGEETVVRVAAPSQGGSGETMPTTGGSAVWIPVAGGILILGFGLWELRRIWMR
jgi:hypothetical protein